jgi:diketogulonate reductase-like aldo/keto reductase
MRTGKIKAIDGTIEMSKIVLGASNYGSEITKECSFEIMDKYYEIGGRAIDTGRIYASYIRNGSSKSEKTVGQWIKERNVRKEFIVVTKGGHPEYSDIHRSRLAPECLEYDINTSLAVLDMDYVDIYFLHRDDKDVPVSEIMDTLDTFVKDGKTPFTVSQIQWNMAYCRQEDMLDNTCLCMTDEEYKGYLNSNIPVMAYSPQAIGFFSKYEKLSLSDIVQHIESVPGLDILVSGKSTPKPAELLGSDSFKKLLNEAKNLYDIIIIDSPPVLTVSDTVIISQLVNGVLLIVAAKETNKDVVLNAKKTLEKVGVNIMGIILTKTKVKNGNYYYSDK